MISVVIINKRRGYKCESFITYSNLDIDRYNSTHLISHFNRLECSFELLVVLMKLVCDDLRYIDRFEMKFYSKVILQVHL